MRGGVAQPVPGESEWDRAGAAVALQCPAFDWLSLPEIPREQSHPYVKEDKSGKVTRLARSMLKAGLLRDEPSEAALSEIAVKGLQQWIDGVWGKQRLFELQAAVAPDFFCTVGMEADGPAEQIDGTLEDLYRAITKDCGAGVCKDHMALSITSARRHDVLVGDGVEALEAVVPGLGFSALSAVERYGQEFGLLGSQFMLHAAQQMYWCGGDSEKDFLEMYGEDEGSFSGVTRAEFDEVIPPRMLKPECVGNDVLAEVVRSGGGTARRVALLLLELRAMGKKAGGFEIDEVRPFFHWDPSLSGTVLLGWKDWEDHSRIADDYANNYWGGECNEQPAIGILIVPLDDPKWFARQAKRWQAQAKTLRMIDELLLILSGEEDGSCKRS